MKIHLAFSTICSLISVASLPAQSSMTLHADRMAGLDTIQLLEQHALTALMGAVVFIGIIWVAYVYQCCARLSKPQSSSRSIMPVLALVVVMSAFCSSCGVAQRSLMAQNRDNMAKSVYCNCIEQLKQENHSGLYVKNSYIPYSNCQGPVFCRVCGHRIVSYQH